MITTNFPLGLAFLCFCVQGYGSEDFPSLDPMEVTLAMADVVREGDNLTITCHYDLHGDKLYAAKLFFGEEEFYRYVPKDEPPIHVFFFSPDLNSMVTQTANEKMCQVTLKRMPTSWTGLYQCEVSADQPSFQTTIVSRYLTVTEDPVSRPIITVNRYILREGETLRARCSSVGGTPPANLTWTINGVSVDSKARSHVVEGEVEETISSLQIVITPELIPNSRILTLHCAASQFNLYNATSEVKLKIHSGQPGASSIVSNSGTHLEAASALFLVLPLLSIVFNFSLLNTRTMVYPRFNFQL